MREVTLDQLREFLRQAPAMVEMHPLSLAFLPEDVRVFPSAREMIAELDSPALQPADPLLALGIDPALRHRLPALRCVHDPLTTDLNQVLLRRFELVRQHLLGQSSVAEHIATRTNVGTIVLLLVDGLSYADLKQHAPERLDHVTPVLVDGVSNTEQGMRRLIGRPSLAQRLFDLGFRRLLGFTYWERAGEPLTDALFLGFGDQVRRVKSMAESLAVLEQEDLEGAFVQIVRTGLDGLAHRQRERPDRRAAVQHVLQDLDQLVGLLSHKGVTAWVHLVSDHGILWSDEHALIPYEFAGAEESRFYQHSRGGDHVLTLIFEGKEFALLEYPYLRRELRSNEWGVHGGLSFEESVVPLLSYHVEGHF